MKNAARVTTRYRKEKTIMEWSDYIVMAAKHSRHNAGHWFRYLRKDIDKCGVTFTKEEVESLHNNELLTPFQRVSIAAAFKNGTPTRRHIIRLNDKADLTMISKVRRKFESS